MSKAQADRIKGPPMCPPWSILCLKAPEKSVTQLFLFPDSFASVGSGGVGEGWELQVGRESGDERKALWGNFRNRLYAIVSPPVAASLGGVGGALLPRAQAARLPPTASGQAPGRPRSSRNSKEPSQVQVCAFLA